MSERKMGGHTPDSRAEDLLSGAPDVGHVEPTGDLCGGVYALVVLAEVSGRAQSCFVELRCIYDQYKMAKLEA